MAAVSRKPVRQQLAIDIAVDMTTAHTVYDHRPATLNGSPAVLVISVNTLRNRRLTQSGQGQEFFFEIHNLVRNEFSTTYTEEDAEDALDDLEFELAGWMEDPTNTKSTFWQSFRYDGPTILGRTKIGGIEYQDEIVSIVVVPSG